MKHTDQVLVAALLLLLTFLCVQAGGCCHS